jgi:Leucine-rich repeat (LRR) protein
MSQNINNPSFGELFGTLPLDPYNIIIGDYLNPDEAIDCLSEIQNYKDISLIFDDIINDLEKVHKNEMEFNSIITDFSGIESLSKLSNLEKIKLLWEKIIKRGIENREIYAPLCSDESDKNDIFSEKRTIPFNQIKEKFEETTSIFTYFSLIKNITGGVDFLQKLDKELSSSKKIEKIEIWLKNQDLFQITELDLSPAIKLTWLYSEMFFIPKEIKLFKNLKNLKLAENHITLITDSLNTLAKLETLDLSSNNLKTIPEKISNLKQLKELNLSTNRIQNLDNLGKFDNLEILHLSDNLIKSISVNFIDHFPSLKILDLDNNPITILPKEIFRKNLEIHLGAFTKSCMKLK